MTIQRDHYDGPITFVCDFCGDEDHTRCEDFGGALAKYKSHGGRAVKQSDGTWEHYCTGCKGFG